MSYVSLCVIQTERVTSRKAVEEAVKTEQENTQQILQKEKVEWQYQLNL